MRFDGDGPWELEVQGFEVLHMTFGTYLIDIVAYGPEGAMSTIRLEGPFDLHCPDGAHQRLDPQTDPWDRFIGLFALRHDTICLVQITNASELYVSFASGHRLASTADERYENWEIRAPGGVQVVAPPGGGEPLLWDGDPSRTTRVRYDGKRSRGAEKLDEPS